MKVQIKAIVIFFHNDDYGNPQSYKTKTNDKSNYSSKTDFILPVACQQEETDSQQNYDIKPLKEGHWCSK